MTRPILCGKITEDPDRQKMYYQQRNNDEFSYRSTTGEVMFRHLGIPFERSKDRSVCDSLC